MRKLLPIMVLSLLLAGLPASAVKAPRRPFQYIQPDGTVVTLMNHGDEWHNWTTMGDTPVFRDRDGFYRPAGTRYWDGSGNAEARAVATRARAAALDNHIASGRKHFLVILIEFDDINFTLDNPHQAFYNMLNQVGYSDNGGTGSVADYYVENSDGKFMPIYDVYGPVTLPRNHIYYGEHPEDNPDTADSHADEALYEACKMLDDEVDFSEYDHDGDGYVDGVFYYFAGHNEAEGGGPDTIWPHSWALYRHKGYFDGVRVWSYACASEYRWSEGEEMCGIGTFCHEFGHVLGLPDFYDTDYEKNGQAETVDMYSLMDGGCYNNRGRTPPLLGAVERWILGWMDEPQMLFSAGSYSLAPIGENDAMRIPADIQGEDFILEYRDGTGWDAYVEEGLIIYHRDRSKNRVSGSMTAQEMWYGNSLNCYADHPCYYLITNPDTDYVVFPGVAGTTSASLECWSGKMAGLSLSGISLSYGTLYFRVEGQLERTVSGRVTDMNGKGISGARIMVSRYYDAGASSVMRSAPRYGATTTSTGRYRIELDADEGCGYFVINVIAEGYRAQSVQIEAEVNTVADFSLKSDNGSGQSGVFAAMGFNAIVPPDGLEAGDEYQFSIDTAPGDKPEEIVWYYDGSLRKQGYAKLNAGSHEIRAIIVFSDRTEEITYTFTID